MKEEDIERVDALIAAELPDLVAQDQRRVDARKENTVSGQLRRALHEAGIRQRDGAAAAGISIKEYAAWTAGDAPMPTTAFDRLAELVHLHLSPAD